MNRRDFLLRAGGLAGLGLVSCREIVGPEESPGVLTPAARTRRVVVVGAGLSGLSAAYELDLLYPEGGLYLQVRRGDIAFVPAPSFLSERPAYVKIRGGSDRLPAAFRAALGERVVLESPVTDIAAGTPARTTSMDGRTRESDSVLVTVPVSWQRDPWSRAAWAEPTPGQDRELAGELATPEGPIHFAGEHISGARGWMNGAIESGLRVAAEIHSG